WSCGPAAHPLTSRALPLKNELVWRGVFGENAAMRWYLGLAGLFLMIFAVCALSGPGRIDIADGQTRYAVAPSLVETGDSIVRDDGCGMNGCTGRHGQRYAWYRLPHSLLGVPAILAADATAPPDVSVDADRREMRRHFFFSMIGAVAAAVLA